jgi:hypothetical protein
MLPTTVEDADDVDADADVDSEGGLEIDSDKDSSLDSSTRGFRAAEDLTTGSGNVGLEVLGFTGAGLRSTFALRGVGIGCPGTGAGVFDMLGPSLVCGVDDVRERACANVL